MSQALQKTQTTAPGQKKTINDLDFFIGDEAIAKSKTYQVCILLRRICC